MARTTKELEQEQPRKRSEAAERNARISANRRAKRPLPDTREEADELYRPRDGGNANAPAYGTRLCRLNQIGLLHKTPEGRPITNLEAHELILDYYYPVPKRGANA